MYQVVFSAPVSVGFSKSAGERKIDFEPGRPYVMSTGQHIYLTKTCEGAVWQEAHVESRLRNFVANSLGGRGTLLFYAGAGGYGDQLMAIPVAKFLAELGYAVTVLVDPGNDQCWQNLPWLKGTLPVPLPSSSFFAFDHYALAQIVTNIDEFRDQRHPVDAMLHRFGIDPETVSADKKAVAPVITDAEAQQASQFIGDRAIGLYQMGGSGAARRLNAQASRNMLMALADKVPDIHWLGLYDTHMPAEYYAALPPDAPKNCQLISFAGLRPLFAVAQRARVGVGVDSLLVHLMGSFGRPMVGLWGSTAPALRTAYYAKHVPIWVKTACPYSPCLRYRPVFDRCPPEAKRADTCLCLKEIDPEYVASAVRVALTA